MSHCKTNSQIIHLTFQVQYLKFVLYPQAEHRKTTSQSCEMVSKREGEDVSGLAVDQCLVRKSWQQYRLFELLTVMSNSLLHLQIHLLYECWVSHALSPCIQRSKVV